MALNFLSKKGWHTWSFQNIKKVGDSELKHAAEEKKSDERRKQIVEERERAEFRDLQEKAGLVPKQERVEFLYDSGLAVGRPGGSDNFKEAFSKTKEPPSPAAAKEGSSYVPANDAWRKLHSDPLLMIKQRQHEALSRIKNNPVRMAMIRRQVEAKNPTEKAKEHRKKHHKDSSKHRKHTSDSEDYTAQVERRKSGHRS
jgi:hypothetical protein